MTQQELLPPIAGGRATVDVKTETLPSLDFVTVLTSKGPRLTKRWYRGGDGEPQCEDYQNAKRFKVEKKPIASLDDLKRIIDEIGPRSCLILGRLKDGADPTDAVRRLHDRKLDDGAVEPATIEDTVHYWLPIDVDSVEARDDKGEFDPVADPRRAICCVFQRLPPEFWTADCVWQFTSGAGFKAGIRIRLYFWLSRPLTGAEMKAWLGSWDVVDPSIYVPTQPIYAAPPVFEGVADPVQQRSGMLYLLGPVVPPDSILTNPQKKAKALSGSLAGGEQIPSRISKRQPVRGPEEVDFDEPETIAWAIEVIRADLEAHGRPEIRKYSDRRTYDLIGKLQDGPAWGKSLEPETIAELLKEHWAPHFHLSWLSKKANGNFQNDPGVGPPGAARLFGAGADEFSCHPLDRYDGDPFAGIEPDEQSGTVSSAAESITTDSAPTKPRNRIAPVPKLMPADFSLRKLPRRPYVLGRRFMAGAITLGVAPPGTGKSNFSILTALAIATGQEVTGERVHCSGPVWIHNNEDSLDELYRRIGGVLRHHGIDFESVRENIYVTSGLDEPLVIAMKEKDVVKRTMAVAEVIASIREKGIIHLVIDPFVSTHRGVSENANEEMEQVAEAIRHIAHETGCSIDLIHHALKSHSQNSEHHAGDMNAARGAGALTAAVRIVYTLAAMSEVTGKAFGLLNGEWAQLVRLDHGKGNYSARDTSVRWFELVTVNIENGCDLGDGLIFDGDTVAVPVRWHPPLGHAPPAPADDDSKEAKLQRVREVVAAAMSEDRCPLSKVIEPVKAAFGVEKSAARDLVMEAIAEGKEAEAKVGARSCLLTLERQSPSPPKPVFLVRRWVVSETTAA
jgi:hypothetical protein